MEEPLLSGEFGEKEKHEWSSYQYVGRTGTVHGTAPSSIEPEVSVEEIRSASAFSDPYPPSIHAALISSPEPDPKEQAVAFQGGYGGGVGGNTLNEIGRQILDEVEIRELLIDHVGHRCCWGSRPARRWKISTVEDCNVYVGTLETFIEERDTAKETEPYHGAKFDGKDQGPELGAWELDLRSEFPLLFVPHKATRAKIPHSEAIEKCSGCEGRGEIACPTCNAGQEPGLYKENQMTQCPACYGRGLIAHRDGSDTLCVTCSGKGKLPCATCGSHGHLKCAKCQGQGSLLTRNVAVVKWTTLSTRKVSATSGAGSVPDEVFHRARGVQLCNTQAYQCTPAYFADSFLLNKFSSDVIADRSPVPPTARVICERHMISVVPVTRVTMAHRNRSFSFYIIGLSREVYIKGYPSQFCWGLCPCLNWLRI
ncbi:chaperone protein dnaJ-like protein [Tasmannia lanceolata]|uniref:chaperone protein dnaJ-like protein n=1 Tax=Tasmannia lanceolata TaxID=3420 RepID=UPI004063360D